MWMNKVDMERAIKREYGEDVEIDWDEYGAVVVLENGEKRKWGIFGEV